MNVAYSKLFEKKKRIEEKQGDKSWPKKYVPLKTYKKQHYRI